MWNCENGLESFRKWIRLISCFLLIWTGWTGVSILPELQAQKCSSFTLTKTAPMHTCASCKHPTYAFICFYLALQILPVWFFLVACFSTHCLFCHFTISRSGLSRFPPLVTWPSVPLCSLKHVALINSLSIYNPSSLCLRCQIAKQNRNASNKHPNQNKQAREGWNKPFCKLITRQIDYWLLSGCVSSAHVLCLDVGAWRCACFFFFQLQQLPIWTVMLLRFGHGRADKSVLDPKSLAEQLLLQP